MFSERKFAFSDACDEAIGNSPAALAVSSSTDIPLARLGGRSGGYLATPSRVWGLQAGRGDRLAKWGEAGCSGDPRLPKPGWAGRQGSPPKGGEETEG